MDITGIGGYSPLASLDTKSKNRQNMPAEPVIAGPVGAEPTTNATTSAASLASKDDAVAEFMQYMAKSPAERMQEAWLAQHGYTKEQFDALPPEKKQALIEQMKQEIEEKLKEQAKQNPGAVLNVFT
jgi:hypothetical protein